MRKVMLLAAGALALGAASSAGAGGGVVASASGGYGYHRHGGGELLRRPPVHVERPAARRRQRARPVQLHAGPRRRRAVGERLAHVRDDHRQPGLGRRDHRGELARVARRPRHVVPGAGQRRGCERSARHVVDARRRRAGHGARSTATTTPSCCSRSSSSAATCRCGRASSCGARGSDPASRPRGAGTPA